MLSPLRGEQHRKQAARNYDRAPSVRPARTRHQLRRCLLPAIRHSEMRAASTGNLYFEVENTRQREPSGVAATTADRWCHVLDDDREALLIDVWRRLVVAGVRAIQVGVDGAVLISNSRGLLVSRGSLEASRGVSLVRLPTVEEFFGQVFRGALQHSDLVAAQS